MSCDNCLAKEKASKKLLFCGKCGQVKYCNKKCQLAKLSEHKLVCQSPINRSPTSQPRKKKKVKEEEKEVTVLNLSLKTTLLEDGEIILMTKRSLFIVNQEDGKKATIMDMPSSSDRSSRRITIKDLDSEDIVDACLIILTSRLKTSVTYNHIPEIIHAVLLDNHLLYVGFSWSSDQCDMRDQYGKGKYAHICIVNLRDRTIKYGFKYLADTRIYPLDGYATSKLFIFSSHLATHAKYSDASDFKKSTYQLWDPVTSVMSDIPLSNHLSEDDGGKKKQNLIKVIRSKQPGWAFLIYSNSIVYQNLRQLLNLSSPVSASLEVDKIKYRSSHNIYSNVWPGRDYLFNSVHSDTNIDIGAPLYPRSSMDKNREEKKKYEHSSTLHKTMYDHSFLEEEEVESGRTEIGLPTIANSGFNSDSDADAGAVTVIADIYCCSRVLLTEDIPGYTQFIVCDVKDRSLYKVTLGARRILIQRSGVKCGDLFMDKTLTYVSSFPRDQHPIFSGKWTAVTRGMNTQQDVQDKMTIKGNSGSYPYYNRNPPDADYYFCPRNGIHGLVNITTPSIPSPYDRVKNDSIQHSFTITPLRDSEGRLTKDNDGSHTVQLFNPCQQTGVSTATSSSSSAGAATSSSSSAGAATSSSSSASAACEQVSINGHGKCEPLIQLHGSMGQPDSGGQWLMSDTHAPIIQSFGHHFGNSHFVLHLLSPNLKKNIWSINLTKDHQQGRQQEYVELNALFCAPDKGHIELLIYESTHFPRPLIDIIYNYNFFSKS